MPTFSTLFLEKKDIWVMSLWSKETRMVKLSCPDTTINLLSTVEIKLLGECVICTIQRVVRTQMDGTRTPQTTLTHPISPLTTIRQSSSHLPKMIHRVKLKTTREALQWELLDTSVFQRILNHTRVVMTQWVSIHERGIIN
jgi:hypothetical protein